MLVGNKLVGGNKLVSVCGNKLVLVCGNKLV